MNEDVEQEEVKTEFHVEVVKLGPMTKHPGADTLSIVDVNGYPVVVRTEDFKEGDLAVYIPVDSVVPTDRECFRFLLTGNSGTARIKARRFRGVFSMGLLIFYGEAPEALGEDVAEKLGITKYVTLEERKNEASATRRAGILARRKELVKLPVYGLDPLRKYAGLFNPGEQVIITEKIHGANARFVFYKGRLHVGSHRTMRGATPSRVREFFDRVKIMAKILLGSPTRAHVVLRAGDIWWETAEKYQLKERLEKKPGFVLYGEIYGEGVQDLTYDSPKGRKFRAFDVYDMHTGKFLNHDKFIQFIRELGLSTWNDVVPKLAEGEWGPELDAKARAWADKAGSSLAGHLIEGVVVKPFIERDDPRTGRVAMKYAGEGYLLRKDAA